MQPILMPLFMVLVSGFTGLVYQVTWQQYLAIYLGSHGFATALILSVFFMSLSIGYLVIGHYAHKLHPHKFFLYGILEGLIGLYCLLSPGLFRVLSDVFAFSVAGAVPNFFVQLGFTILFIGFPTFLMGGTIPVVTQALTGEFESSHRIHAWVYGTNTAGAFAGTVLAGFYFVEQWGLGGTLYRTSVVNLLIFIAIAILAMLQPHRYRGLEPVETSTDPAERDALRYRFPLLAVSFLSGFCVFSLETLVIRMAGFSIGGSTYTYSVVVASFILAIAAGSFTVSLIKRELRIQALVGYQVLLLLTCVGLYVIIEGWPLLFTRIRMLFATSLMNFNIYWGLVLFTFVLLLLIPVGLMGMNLPLLFHYLKNRNQLLAKTIGQIYAFNSIGSALGASLGGYVLFYYLSGAGIYRLSLIAMIVAMSCTIWLCFRTWTDLKWVMAPVGCLLAVALLPDWDPKQFTPGPFLHRIPTQDGRSARAVLKQLRERQKNDFLFHKDGPNTSVSVLEINDLGDRTLYLNGKADATTNSDHITRMMAALYPFSLANTIDRVFIIGLGAGLSTSVAESFDDVKAIEVAEISPVVVEALPYFDRWNDDLTKKEATKYQITVGDAYKVLQNRHHTYDVIISEPTHPWVVGVEKLFSLEFLKKAAAKLSEEGLYAQWLPLFNLPPETTLAVLNNFQAVFPYVTIWGTSGNLTFTLIGSRYLIRPNLQLLTRRFESAKAIYAKAGLKHEFSILSGQILPPGSVAHLLQDVETYHTLEHPLVAFTSRRAYFAGIRTDLVALLQEHLKAPVDPALESNQFVYQLAEEKLPQAFYQTSRRQLRSKHYHRSVITRLQMDYARAYPEANVFRSKNTYRRYGYIAGYYDKFPGRIQNIQGMELVLNYYQNLLLMHFPAKIERVRTLFPPRETFCSSEQIKEDERERCQKAYEQLAEFEQATG